MGQYCRLLFIATIFLISGCQTQHTFYTEPGSEAQKQFRPDVPEFYSSVDTVKNAVKSRCKTLEVRDLSLLLDVVRKSQRQIDCKGFAYRGKERFMELMFSDDELDLVIVLIEPEEHTALSRQFKEIYGMPTHDSEIGQFYYYDSVAIRTRPYEVVFTSRRARGQYQLYMDDMAQKAVNEKQQN